ncbi:phage tail-collar fiber domain-containing protein [Mitsuokella sp.]|uniref:phage tail-collar fiber domain-containing protein n=1 Tax=Mitsuokella sp. TaxID=2049034 RepID=UPI003D7C9AD9
MANWTGGLLTAAGRSLQAKVEAGKCKLNLTKIKLGDGSEEDTSIDSLKDLVSPKSVLKISDLVQKDNICTVTGVILTTDVTEGYYAREWGLFADDPDDGSILYMISLDPNPDWIPASSSAVKVSATYAMNIAISNASNITSTIDPTGLVTTEMLNNATGMIQRSTAYAVGNIGYDRQLYAHPDWRLECTTAGTTGTELLDLSSAKLGDKITDGTVVWTVKRLCVTTDVEYMWETDSNGDVMPVA